jgi:hypothetical protein
MTGSEAPTQPNPSRRLFQDFTEQHESPEKEKKEVKKPEKKQSGLVDWESLGEGSDLMEKNERDFWTFKDKAKAEGGKKKLSVMKRDTDGKWLKKDENGEWVKQDDYGNWASAKKQ